ncbi:Smr/MutS family protein [Anditalea andensis]|uniref:DNA mismatch repair protein MutS n=1 Tax=Anditalea andensis TaxID=1048983 RepID=A0A074KY60_9BACT|nr:Smr/MutS family protein [Anditalea andensis]KEO74926.1 DNA mismatch repair protein MutS [Anditalea andensis]
MNIGDRVRLLRGNEEGVITKISSAGRMEIEIEDGFRIPVLKNEVVLISAAERQYFGDGKVVEKPTIENKTSPITKEGIFLSYVPLNDKDHSLYVINLSEKDQLYMVSEIFGTNSRTLASGVLSRHSYEKFDQKSIKDFEQWPSLLFQMIPINKRAEKTLPPFERKIKFKASAFFKSRGKAPLLEKEGYLFQIDQHSQDLDIKQLNQTLNEGNKISNDPKSLFHRPAKEIDLHIEKLNTDHQFMSNTEMLKLQMETFEKNLNYAIASGMDEISFIHGIGNGVLKNEIHKYLSQLENIKYFQDTQKSRFGYGATLVRIN